MYWLPFLKGNQIDCDHFLATSNPDRPVSLGVSSQHPSSFRVEVGAAWLLLGGLGSNVLLNLHSLFSLSPKMEIEMFSALL